MPEQIPFINREHELALIHQCITEKETKQIICVDAPGGIGKTRLLQQIYKLYSEHGYNKTLLMPCIIDFDDQAFHIPLNIEQRLAQMLGEKAFENYLRTLLDWRRMELSGISGDKLKMEREILKRTFQESFNRLSSKKRIILLFDTTDALERTDAWNYILEFSTRLRNLVLIVAGRNTRNIYNSLTQKNKINTFLIELEPLEMQAAQSYLEEKQNLLSLHLPHDLCEKIALLAQGKPILIDLAIEWLARDIPLDWLMKNNLQKLRMLTKKEKKQYQQEFEYKLVQHITQIRNPIDTLILTLSRVYPMNIEMAQQLLTVPTTKAEELFKEAQSYVFVKSLPDGRISLHDEVRRMITEYAWPEVDPNGGRQRWYSERAAQYLEEETQKIGEKIAVIQSQIEQKGIENSYHSFIEQETLERTLWVVQKQRLHHTLYYDLGKGFKVFTALFDKAIKNHRTEIQGTLLNEIQGYLEQLKEDQGTLKQYTEITAEQHYAIAIRQAQYAFNLNQYTKVQEIILTTLEQLKLSPVQQVEMFRLLGNAEIRIGEQSKGVSRFKQASDIASQIQDQDNRVEKQAEVQNALGWGYRLLGQIEKAIEQYESALNYATQINDKELVASILNNLGYAYHLTGHKAKGLRYCLQALEIVPSTNLQQIGYINSTLGEIKLGLGHYEESSKYYEEALSYFKEIANNEGQAIVYMEISHSKRHLASIETIKSEAQRKRMLEDALDNATRSIEICNQYNLRKEKPLSYYEMGRVLLDLERFEEAEIYLAGSYPLNLKREGGFALADLTALAEIAYRTGNYAKVEYWVNETKDAEKQASLLRTERADFTLFYGRLLRFQAEAQLALGRHDEGLTTYLKALGYIANHGGYGSYRFERELDRLKQNIAQLPSDIKQNWCNQFIKEWENNAETTPYSEVPAVIRLARII